MRSNVAHLLFWQWFSQMMNERNKCPWGLTFTRIVSRLRLSLSRRCEGCSCVRSQSISLPKAAPFNEPKVCLEALSVGIMCLNKSIGNTNRRLTVGWKNQLVVEACKNTFFEGSSSYWGESTYFWLRCVSLRGNCVVNNFKSILSTYKFKPWFLIHVLTNQTKGRTSRDILRPRQTWCFRHEWKRI